MDTQHGSLTYTWKANLCCGGLFLKNTQIYGLWEECTALVDWCHCLFGLSQVAVEITFVVGLRWSLHASAFTLGGPECKADYLTCVWSCPMPRCCAFMLSGLCYAISYITFGFLYHQEKNIYIFEWKKENCTHCQNIDSVECILSMFSFLQTNTNFSIY